MVHNSPIDIVTKNFSGEYDCKTTVDEMCKWFRKRVDDQIYEGITYSNSDDTIVTINTPYVLAWDCGREAYTCRVSSTRKESCSKKSKRKGDCDNTSKELDSFLSEFKVKEAVGNG